VQFTGRLSALRHRDYFRYWTGSFASVGATQLQTMAQGWLLYELTESAVALGYLGAAAAIPAIVMTLFGGAVADRFNKKHVLMLTSLLVTLAMAALALLDFTEAVRPWHIIGIAALVSFISGFDWPTRQAIFPTLIEREDMLSAVALNSIIWQSSRMIMPAIGGILIALIDTWLVFALCAGGFLSMFFVVSGLRIAVPTRAISQSTLQQVSEGLGFIMREKLFLLYFSLTYAGMFFGMSHMQLMPAFAALLGVGEASYGLLLSATGVGSLVGTLLVGYFQHSRRLPQIILANAAASAIAVYLFAFAAAKAGSLVFAYPLALFAIFLVSMFSSMFMICSMTVLQLKVPDQLRGRVMGIYGITYSLMPLGGLLAGWLASQSSAPVAIVIGASMYLLIIVSITTTQPQLRQVTSD
jgi:MFS family permease